MARSSTRKPSPLTTATWAHHRVRTLELVSGAGTVKVEPTRLNRAIIGGQVPNPLREMAIRQEYKGIDLDDLQEEEIETLEDFKDWIIADSMRDPKVTVEFVRDEMPTEDREQLFAICTHQDLLVRLLGKFRPQPTGVGADGNGADGGKAAE